MKREEHSDIKARRRRARWTAAALFAVAALVLILFVVTRLRAA